MNGISESRSVVREVQSVQGPGATSRSHEPKEGVSHV
jgi:hypothetical protein